MKDRLARLETWIAAIAETPAPILNGLSVDASHRHYYRTFIKGRSLIAVDAPPHLEKNPEFIKVSRHLLDLGLIAPDVEAADLDQGFLLVSDLGDRTYSDAIGLSDDPDPFYRQAIDNLIIMQTGPHEHLQLPRFDREFCLKELALFNEWLVGGLLHQDAWPDFPLLENLLWGNINAQPGTFMHRDYHSRNLMCCPDGLGILDFQDAVTGPVSYDLVSLLRDCYLYWPGEAIDNWIDYYLDQADSANLISVSDHRQFRRWFDLTGLQRHLKCAGIFSRLSIRDAKHIYLAELPRVLGYIHEVSRQYSDLQPFNQWFETIILDKAAIVLGDLIGQ